MRNSRHFVSLRTFSLAFAVALSPVWLQTPSGCEPGDGTLSTLELEAAGQNQIAFDPEQVSYSVWLPVGVEPVLVRAYSTDPAATVWYKLDASVTIARGKLPNGGGEFTLDTIPSGQSTLTINVTSPSGLVWGTYTVAIGVGDVFPCTEQGILDAIAQGGGPHRFDCNGPTTVVASVGFDNDVILDGEGILELESARLVEPLGGCGWPINSSIVRYGVTVELRRFTLSSPDQECCHFFGPPPWCACPGWYRSPCPTFTNDFGGTLILVDSNVTGPGAFNNRGTLIVADSTVSVGIPVISTNTLVVTNSTITGIYADGAPATVINSTVAGTGATVSNMKGGTVTLANTIVEGECAGDAVTSLGHNIESPGNTCGFDQATDQVDVPATALNLGPLQDNGGPTMTHALLPGSVAIDQIPEAECVDAEGAPLATDQRGEPRPVAILGPEPKCDVGAFELEQ